MIEARTYNTVYGPWTYFTADDGQVRTEEKDYLAIGTLESYRDMRAYYGKEMICPIYIEVEDGERLKRAIAREEKQEQPHYAEMCRRFLADTEDFSEEKLKQTQDLEVQYLTYLSMYLFIFCILGSPRFLNNNLEACIQEIRQYIKKLTEA